MSQTIRFGLTLSQRAALFGATRIADLVALAADADRNPLFDSVWVGDSLFSKPRPDAIALLGALTVATGRVRLGVGCMASFPVRDPIVFAYQWATLDLMSEGRMQLAVCTGLVGGGASQNEGRPWGIPDADRVKRMSENIDICRALWTGENVSHRGAFREFADVAAQPRPVQQPCPIWIAANPNAMDPKRYGPSMRRVARKADGWMSSDTWPGQFGRLWNALQEELRAQGRDPDTFPNIAYHNINVNEDEDQAYRESKKYLDLYYGPVFNETMVRAWTAMGTVESCVKHIRAMRDSGAKAITLRITSWDLRRQYERLVTEVLPQV